MRVAAFFTPQASLARCSASPDLVHSCLIHCLTGIGPSGPVTLNVRWYSAHTSVTTGNCLMVRPFTLPAMCPRPLSQTIS